MACSGVMDNGVSEMGIISELCLVWPGFRAGSRIAVSGGSTVVVLTGNVTGIVVTGADATGVVAFGDVGATYGIVSSMNTG